MTASGLFDVMHEAGWTTLVMKQNVVRNEITVSASTEWEKDTDWSSYEQGWQCNRDSGYCGIEPVLRTIRQKGVLSHYESVADLMEQGKHARIELLLDHGQDIRFINGVHSTTLGSPAGGIRRHDRNEDELDVIADILNLGRGMSFKNAAAGILNGGCKLGIHASIPESERDEGFYGFLAYCIDRSEAFTGPDMGLRLEDANRIRKYTKNIVGGTSKTGSSGATGISAGYGVFLAIKELLAEGGYKSFDEVSVAIQGLGELGMPLAGHLIKAGADLILADVDPDAIQKTLDGVELRSGQKVEECPVEEILSAKCDILAPCAVGGVLSECVIADLQCRMVLGGANNQLRASSQQEELRLARLLDERGIVFIPDWILNAGGVIHGKMEHVRGSDFSLDDALAETARIVPKNVEDVLNMARLEKISPTEAAYRKFEKIVYKD